MSDDLRQLASECCRGTTSTSSSTRLVPVGSTRSGVCRAAPFVDARRALETRKARGFDAGMQFTYRNPARSTDPVADGAAVRSR